MTMAVSGGLPDCGALALGTSKPASARWRSRRERMRPWAWPPFFLEALCWSDAKQGAMGRRRRRIARWSALHVRIPCSLRRRHLPWRGSCGRRPGTRLSRLRWGAGAARSLTMRQLFAAIAVIMFTGCSDSDPTKAPSTETDPTPQVDTDPTPQTGTGGPTQSANPDSSTNGAPGATPLDNQPTPTD
jgi:hypothetical protein